MRERAADEAAGRAGLGDRGFSLVETLLAVLILAVGLTLVLRSFGSSLDALGNSADYTRALALVEQKLWDLEAKGSIAPGTHTGQFSEEEHQNFRWEVKASAPLEMGLCETQVTILWARRGRARAVSVVTYLRRE
jgi:prepilin-type N-terminal cleavage/methylation domain-containing protein